MYLTDTPSSALFETLVHFDLDPDELPEHFQLLRVEIPEHAMCEDLTEDDLPENWRQYEELTRNMGDAWLEKGETLLLGVPSSIVPHTRNYLFNPAHEDATECELYAEEHQYDHRLFKIR